MHVLELEIPGQRKACERRPVDMVMRLVRERFLSLE